MAEYISREKAIEAIKQTYCSHCNSYNGAMCRACEHMDDIDIIEDTPTADVQPVAHAEWIGFTKSAFLGCDDIGEPIFRDTTVWKCSHCGRNTVVRDNFCPNCGARMDGDSE